MNTLQITSRVTWKKFVPAFCSTLSSRNCFSSSSSDRLVSVVENEKLQIATVFMQRAPVNSLNLELIQQLTAAMKDLEKRKFQGFILASKSPTVFSAGLDIMEMYNAKEERFREFWTSLQELWKTLYGTPLITMAAINGHAPAGGCMMSLSCDYRIMVDTKATIGMNETLLGIAAPEWFRDVIINGIGYRMAEKSLFLGTLHTPQQALALNMVDELVSNAEELESKIQHQMGIWLKIPGTARRMTKMGLRKPFINKLESYQAKELEDTVRLVLSDVVQNALGKYIEALKAKKA